jgi:uncharacterized damage-inducible protein DinB
VTSDEIFLKFSAVKLEQLSGRIQDCLARLTEEQIWTRNTENENAIGNLVLHLCGNLRQWIGSGVAGKPDVRDRDSEFQARKGLSGTQLAERLRERVSEVTEIVRNLPPTHLSEQMTAQDYNVTVLEAIYHVVEHFSQHTGQILFATKMITGQDLGYYRHLNKPKHAEATP